MMAERKDLFENLLSIEDDFFEEGYKLGVHDGKRAGLIDGRSFGLKNGFEKFSTMGRLHGRAMVWAGRLPFDRTIDISSEARPIQATKHLDHPRLIPYVRVLYALTEPDSLSTENAEDSVPDFDDRLKRAEGKFKLIERLTSEVGRDDQKDNVSKSLQAKGDGEIEDTSASSSRQ